MSRNDVKEVDEITINRCDNGFTIDVWYKEEDESSPFADSRKKRPYVAMNKTGVIDIVVDALNNN